MTGLGEIAHLLVRQTSGIDAGSGTVQEPIEGAPGHCSSSNDYDGRLGVRVSAIFVILIGSLLGAWFPVYAKRHPGVGVPEWAFFVVKFFGSGVIIATAFIHLLAPANTALTNPCLTGVITLYPWTEGIALIMVFALFFIELMTMRYASFGHNHGHDRNDDGFGHGHGHNHSRGEANAMSNLQSAEEPWKVYGTAGDALDRRPSNSHIRGEDHLGHARQHIANEDIPAEWEEHGRIPETYAAQMTAIFILEFGVIFHSIFIGLTLAVAGEEFITLYIVLAFHQTFEGLGLGTRLAVAPWPKSKRWTPYLLAIGYGLSTPLAIAIGLGVRGTYPPGSQTTLIVNGVFDAISAGILIYTGLVELMAHEFMFSPRMQKAPIKEVLSAFALMCLGAGLMALLGRWA